MPDCQGFHDVYATECARQGGATTSEVRAWRSIPNFETEVTAGVPPLKSGVALGGGPEVLYFQ